jgi:hypothetical protein
MSWRLTTWNSLLVLAMACAPAYASTTQKKITLSCEVTAGSDVITAQETTVMLCDTPDCSASGNSVACLSSGATIECNSAGQNGVPMSVTMPCDPAPFKVSGFYEHVDVTDHLSNGTTGYGASDVTGTLGGRAYPATSNTSPGSTNDSVTFTIK